MNIFVSFLLVPNQSCHGTDDHNSVLRNAEQQFL